MDELLLASHIRENVLRTGSRPLIAFTNDEEAAAAASAAPFLSDNFEGIVTRLIFNGCYRQAMNEVYRSKFGGFLNDPKTQQGLFDRSPKIAISITL